MSTTLSTFTEPTIVTSDNLNQRSYITFYFNNERIREYHGKNIGQVINPNRAKSVDERNHLLKKLQFELHKALDNNDYPVITTSIREISLSKEKHESGDIITPSSLRLLFEAVRNKLRSDLSRTYKRDLKSVYRSFREFLTPEESMGPLNYITSIRIEKFLSQYGSSGTYFMNKRRNLSIIFSAGGRLIDTQIKSVKETPKRKSKAKLHEKYENDQIKPILSYLKANYPNLHLCCLLTYGSWLRPHEEIRLLTKHNFKKDNTEVHLSGDDNKGGKVRVVYIPEFIRAEVNPKLKQLGRRDNIFSLQSEPFNEYYFNTQWSRAWAKMFDLGLIHENQTIYSFRHTAAVQLYRRTKDVHLLQKLLGHSAITVTLKYLRSLGEINIDELSLYAPSLD
ncbi:tyrosine-type recombinase/integrase [Mucilaginibacter lappiensis]|uniref:tyrosine-type recombinase/integrase n=1 Tax=Mucilaginibacter lappiensis TaxID=354630 RepID=UPI003D1B6933